MKTPTIYDIKYDTSGRSPYFFSTRTLKFFGQTLKSFKVRQSPEGRVFIYAAMRDRFNGRFMGFTFREYKDHNLVTVYNDDGSMFNDDSLSNIHSYINTH